MNFKPFAMSFLLLIVTPFLAHADYDYPYHDPLYATMTSALLKADDTDPDLDQVQDLEYTPIQNRDKIDKLKGRNTVYVKYFPQKEKAPLLIMVSGLGGDDNSGVPNYLAYQFWKKGYQILIFPSPYVWVFALGGSKSGYPGSTPDDTKDLYSLMQLSLKDIEKKGAQVSDIGYLSVSMGSLEGAFLSDLDLKEKKINFKRYLLINPPVDLIYGIHVLDNYFTDGVSHLSKQQIGNLAQRTLTFGYHALEEMDIKDPGYFANLEQRFPLTQYEKEFAVGEDLRDFLSATIYTSQQIKSLGILKVPPSSADPEPRLKEAGQYSFEDYFEKFLVPAKSQERGHPVTKNDLLKESNFYAVGESVKNNPKVFLMHNEDDFLLNPEEKTFLRDTFGISRSTFYPYGGHCGNVWYPENLQAILETFQDFR